MLADSYKGVQHNPVCVLTGASSGLGHALALELANRGYRVLALARSADKLAMLAAQHANIIPYPLDVTDMQALQRFTQVLQQDYLQAGQQPLDLMVLNAGTCEYVDAQALDLAAFERTFALNVQAVVACTAQLLPLLAPAGQIAIVSSLAHLFPFSRSEAYGASKAAISYFADSLRADLAGTEQRVCLIEPGFVDTPLTQKNDFPMPFLITAADAANRIANALQQKAWRLRFPKRLVLSLQLMRCLPYAMRQRLAAALAQKGG